MADELKDFYANSTPPELDPVDYVGVPLTPKDPPRHLKMKAGELPAFLKQELDGAAWRGSESLAQVLDHQVAVLQELRLIDEATVGRLMKIRESLTGFYREDSKALDKAKDAVGRLRPRRR